MKKTKLTKSPKKWIAGAIGKPGTLHKALGVPKGDKIPLSKLKAHDKGNSRTAKRARLAETLRGFKH
jgi:hypothetical protein